MRGIPGQFKTRSKVKYLKVFMHDQPLTLSTMDIEHYIIIVTFVVRLRAHLSHLSPPVGYP